MKGEEPTVSDTTPPEYIRNSRYPPRNSRYPAGELQELCTTALPPGGGGWN